MKEKKSVATSKLEVRENTKFYFENSLAYVYNIHTNGTWNISYPIV